MKPINKKQRNAAILKFILVYILTVIILAFPVYATFQISEKQCDINNEVAEKFKKKYDECTKEKNSMFGKTSISKGAKKDLNRIFNEYLSTHKGLEENVEAMEYVFFSPEKWNEEKVNLANLAADKIMKSQVALKKNNDEFEEIIKNLK